MFIFGIFHHVFLPKTKSNEFPDIIRDIRIIYDCMSLVFVPLSFSIFGVRQVEQLQEYLKLKFNGLLYREQELTPKNYLCNFLKSDKISTIAYKNTIPPNFDVVRKVLRLT